MMQTALFSTAYFAPVQYYSHLYRSSDPVIEQCEHYLKQTWRNRCQIASANGPMILSLPVEAEGKKQASIKEIRISEHGNWQHLHWYSIESAYNSSPYFEFYQDDLRPFFDQKPRFLFDLNESIRTTMCELLGIDPAVRFTDDYFHEGYLPDGWTDYRNLISPKKEAAATDPDFSAKPYYQVFDHKFGFLPNMSILDLLFNMGPESIYYL